MYQCLNGSAHDQRLYVMTCTSLCLEFSKDSTSKLNWWASRYCTEITKLLAPPKENDRLYLNFWLDSVTIPSVPIGHVTFPNQFK